MSVNKEIARPGDPQSRSAATPTSGAVPGHDKPAKPLVTEDEPSSSHLDVGFEATVAQQPHDAANSMLRSKGPCQAPGYVILEPLGSGTYGEVWLAEEERTGVRVAIKFFAHGAGERWQMLQAEVKQLAQLSADPGIVHLIDVEPDSTPPYYIMAFAEQGSLAKRLEKGPLPLNEALEIFRQVAEALAYVHAKGIRHCDLKPGNVLLDACGRVRVADFGQAHLANDASPALGTFFYMAPEQADLGHTIPDTRWDVYGLGALMFAMLTGQAPRADATVRNELAGTAELSHRLRRYRESIQHARPLTEHRKVKGIDKELVSIIERCLAIDPAKRLPDAGAVLAALARRERRRRQRPALVFALVAPMLLVLFTAALGWWLFHDTKEAIRESRRNMDERAIKKNQFIAPMLAKDIHEKLGIHVNMVERVAGQDDVRQAFKAPDRANWKGLLADARKINGKDAIGFLWIAGRNGKILAISTPDGKAEDDATGENFQYRDWFNGKGEQAPGKVYHPIKTSCLSQPYISKLDNKLKIAVSTPVFDSDGKGEVVGIVTETIPFELLKDWIMKLYVHDNFAVILNDRAQYLWHPAQTDHMAASPPELPADCALHEQVFKAGAVGVLDKLFIDPINGKNYRGICAPLQKGGNASTGWIIVIQQDQDSIAPGLEDLNHHLRLISLIAVGVMGVLIPGLWGWLIWMLRRDEGAAHG